MTFQDSPETRKNNRPKRYDNTGFDYVGKYAEPISAHAEDDHWGAPAPEELKRGVCSNRPELVDVFFSSQPRDINMARTLCFTCPVRMACREYASQHRWLKGVWGGLSEHQRQRGFQPAERARRGDVADPHLRYQRTTTRVTVGIPGLVDLKTGRSLKVDFRDASGSLGPRIRALTVLLGMCEGIPYAEDMVLRELHEVRSEFEARKIRRSA